MTTERLVRCDIVSAEQALFSGEIVFLSVTGVMGELGIVAGHTPLLTELKPGPAILRMSSNKEEVFYISGGYLEVQASHISILADTAVRASDIDEKAAIESQAEAERQMQDKRGDIDYIKAATRLAEVAAQMRTLQQLRNRRRN